MARARREPVARAPGRSAFWVQGLACGVLVATAAPLVLVLVLAVALAPVLLWVALALPGQRGQARVLLVYAGAALAPFTATLWEVARDWPAALGVLEAMRVPVLAWAAQAGGWLLGQLAPVAGRMVLEAKVRVRVARLRDARARLQAEWGLEETKNPAAEDPRRG